MKRSHIIAIAVAACLIMVAVALIPRETGRNSDIVPATAAESPEALKAEMQEAAAAVPMLVVDGVSVDPLCFAGKSLEEAAPSYPVRNCDAGGLMPDPDAVMPPYSDRFAVSVYKSRISDEMVRGTVGYRYVGMYQGHYAVWMVENTGGTGMFGSLVLLDYDAAAGRLTTAETLAAGDRCNGSVSGAEINGDTLIYERDVTPYDIMGLIAGPGTDAAKSLPSCAVCCYGRAQFENGALTGIAFDSRLPQALAGKTYGSGQEAEQCFDSILKKRFEQNQSYCGKDDFAAFAGTIAASCAGAEGEKAAP